jgi:peptide/nickel transport system permease protein
MMPFTMKKLPGLAGLVLVGIIVLVAIFANVIAPRSPTSQSLRDRMTPPLTETRSGNMAVLGTDQLGRDLLSRVIKGAQVSVTVAASAVVISGVIGTVLGLISGYYGGVFGAVLMRIIDIQLGIPIILFGIAWIAFFGPGLFSVVLVIVIWGWVKYARLVHVMVLSLKERQFVQASHALGASNRRILFRHIAPNLLGPVIVLATLQLGEAVLLESTLSFLGVGVVPPTPTWGAMVADGRSYVDTAWWIVVLPGAAIGLFVLGSNLLGEFIRDYLDPKTE